MKSPAATVDRQLERYRSMRDFHTTAEPRGRASRNSPAKDDLPFVIQKHAATRLHYDFRLGWRGVLKSWAVTKGPSYFTGDKRLAVQVEDHPIEYGGFEGIIPKGQYGGGTVMVWDQGTWEPHGDVDEGLEKGRLKFALHGTKMHGNWTLIRMGQHGPPGKSNWLLIKEHDEYERPETDEPVTEEAPDSAITGRNLEEIGSQQDHVWGSTGAEKRRPVQAKASVKRKVDAPATRPARKPDAALEKLPKESLAAFIQPELAVQATKPPAGKDWVYELKLDGYRIQARIAALSKSSKAKNAARVSLLTRKGLDWTARMPDIASKLGELSATSALLDGEVVVLTPKGGTSFADLQAAFQHESRKVLTYFVFDLLHLDGKNLRNLPLIERKRLLENLLLSIGKNDIVRLSEHLQTDGATVFAKACQLGAEGIVAKLGSAPYLSGRNASWVKIKCIKQQEFVIGGFTPPSDDSHGIGALLLGYYENGKLIYAGRTGTGFTQKTHRSLRDKVDKLLSKKSPFSELPAAARRNASFIQPKLVAEVSFATWTADNLLRQAAFKGLREDKSAEEVRREIPVDAEPRGEEKPILKKKEMIAQKPANAAKSGSRKSETPLPIRLTNPDKQLDEESHLTKRALADYYWAFAANMLPHIAHRPLSIVRCPEGSSKPCFFQKHVTSTLPDGIESVEIRDRKGGPPEPYITLSTAEALTGLAQMGVLEIHPWGSKNDALEYPDVLVFDLDPDTAIAWSVLAESAREVRSRLKKLGLQSFVKTTGGKGLHIVAPIEPKHEWPVVKEFARAFAERMAADNSHLYLTKMTKSARKNKIYIDFQRNDRGATAIAPYSPRARHGAPVAVPLEWKELESSRAPRFLVANFAEWAKRLRHDPWKDPWNAVRTSHQAISREAFRGMGLK